MPSTVKALTVIIILLGFHPVHAQEASATLSPRTGHRLVYDSGNDRIILFGGNTVNHERVYYDDTWVLSLSENTWTKLPVEGPSPRGEHAMAYSSDHNKVLLFGGVGLTNRLGDTWVFDCDTDTWEWSELEPDFRIEEVDAPREEEFQVPGYPAAVLVTGAAVIVFLLRRRSNDPFQL
jgi:hypothetical protein